MAPLPSQAAVELQKLSVPPPPGSPYAVPIPGTEREGRSPVYRNFQYKDRPLLENFDPQLQTLHDLFENSVAKRATRRCLGWRPWDPSTKTWGPEYVWMSYSQVAERRKNLGAGLVELHREAGITQDKFGVGLWSQNRPEWQITDLAVVSQSLWSVSLYETLGPEASEYILNHGSLSCVVCSLPHVTALLKMAPRVPSLKLIISIDPLEAGEPAGHSKLALLNSAAADLGIKIYSMDAVEAIGARSGRPMRPPHRDDIMTINYTSGTTGAPKGVVITHRSGVSALSGAVFTDLMRPDDVHMSYLPLAHIYGRTGDQTALTMGASIGYFHGDITALVEDMKILRPTGLLSVPRLYNRINNAVQAATIEADGFGGTLSRRVIEAKKASMRLPAGQAHNKHFIYDRIWTPKVTAAVGLSRARKLISGSAQLDPDVQVFLRAAFGSLFVQGFGMTETYAVGFIQYTNDFSVGNIGPPMPCLEVCIESVPEYEYTVHDKPHPRGEMLLRGPVIFKEYYKDPEETAKALESDGWFHTGDIVEADELGRFSIIDRKKNVLKLAQGEYVSPERIENVYMGSLNIVATAYVHGDPKESSLVAIIGVDPAHFAPLASKTMKKPVDPSDLQAIKAATRDPAVIKAVLKAMDDVGRNHKFNSFERVRNCYLDVDPFTTDNELLTPTLKLKRPQTAKAFRAEIDRMYAEIAAQATSKPML